MSSEPLLPWRFAAATLTGASHVQAGRNNQDAWALRTSAHGFAAVVCDGCSGGARSEVGAQLGADLLAALLVDRLDAVTLRDALDDAAGTLLLKLDELSGLVGSSREAWIEDRLLFTVVGAVSNRRDTLIFAFGDGLVSLNGEVRRLGPFENNAPPYLAYRLAGARIEPTLLWEVKTESVRSLLLASDGLADLDVSTLSDDALFLNRDALRRRLWQQRKAGVVGDDATAVLVRRWAEA